MGGIVIETNGIQLGALNFSKGAGVNNAQCADAAFALISFTALPLGGSKGAEPSS
jgi:hypothetical protein